MGPQLFLQTFYSSRWIEDTDNTNVNNTTVLTLESRRFEEIWNFELFLGIQIFNGLGWNLLREWWMLQVFKSCPSIWM
jgi:hypothetical protein